MIDWGADINRYHNGEMTPEEEHAFEKKALNDPFLAEALEGASLVSSNEFSEDLSLIQKQINQKTKKNIWLWPLRIAASVTLILISYFAIAPYFEKNAHQNLAVQESNKPDQKQDAIRSTQDEKVQSEDRLDTFNQQPIAPEKEKVIEPSGRGAAGNQPAITPTLPEVTSTLNDAQSEDKLSKEEVEKAILENERIAAQKELLKSTLAESQKAEQKQMASRSSTLSYTARTVQGKVLSAEDNTPVPGVNVVIKGTDQGTVTDINGNYKLVIKSGDTKLVYSFIGLQTTEADITEQGELIVKLQPDVAQLSEVVVTGYSPYQMDETREPVIKLAEPAGGKRAYDKYLHNSIRYPQQALENKVKGRVTVKFTVRTDGSLDEFNVLKGLGYGCDEEVIRLVKEGPKWTPTTEDSVPVESEVRVRVKFALPD